MCPKVIVRQTIRDYIGLRRVLYEACLHCSKLTTNMLRNNAEGDSFVLYIFTNSVCDLLYKNFSRNQYHVHLYLP